MFLSRNKKNNVYPCKPQFYYIKVEFKGVKIILVCFRDVDFNSSYTFLPGCDKRPTLKDTLYEVHVGRGHWIEMPCAPGTAFNPVDCKCSLTLMTIPGKRSQQGNLTDTFPELK